VLKILIITQDDPFYIPIFFKELFSINIDEKFHLAGVVIQAPFGKKSIKKLFKQMLSFYGFKNIILVSIRYLIYKILALIATRFFHGKFPGVFSTRHILLKKGYDIIDLGNINSKESIELMNKLEVDVIFSVAASQIFKKEILDLPRLGCYNIHTSKLPKNRGMMPNFWSLYNYDEDPVSAITIHKMNEKLDDGKILVQNEFKLNPAESLDKLIRRTKKMSVEVFIEAINQLSNELFSFMENDSSASTYNTFPTREDVLKFESKGFKII
jgi:methionyl-tRNA formyltransferase